MIKVEAMVLALLSALDVKSDPNCTTNRTNENDDVATLHGSETTVFRRLATTASRQSTVPAAAYIDPSPKAATARKYTAANKNMTLVPERSFLADKL